ncbi:PilC/PilY family type IV pilus protein [Acinetobacter sp. YH12254]|uniref:PilC/PilY family type IV pilus protein n=1 Tax=Acinetobacter sp. YH12254 TaxID=2601178 RepID=UPI00211EF239|nr:PilC/PilY family type IV pilus protein [Acinetobacter sp. YH12254]
MKNSTQMKKKWMQFKVSALSASVTALIVSGIPTQISASDIDIYQAGGTGNIDVHFMLDISGSMGVYSLFDDYQYYDSNKKVKKLGQSCETKAVSYGGYEKVSTFTANKGIKVITFTDWAWSSEKNYKKYENNYYEVAYGSGDYKISQIYNADKWSNKNDLYIWKDELLRKNETTCRDEYACIGTRQEYNSVYSIKDGEYLSENLTVQFGGNGYIYAPQGEAYCRVELGVMGTSNVEEEYKNKIKRSCEPESSGSDTYRCLTRLAKMKKGLLELVASDTTQSHMNYSLGYYPLTDNTQNGAVINFGTSKNQKKFLAMDKEGKQKFLTEITKLKAFGGTPISQAYEVSRGLFDKTAVNAKQSCLGQGIYFLTDGEPSSAGNNYWSNIHTNAASKRTVNGVLTATVGFGGGYDLKESGGKGGFFKCDSLIKNDHKSLCNWGEKAQNNGKGGFYNAQSTQDLVKSIEQFVDDVSVEIEGSTMGTNTIPVDALDSTRLQNYSYFPMFKPIAGGKEQLWAGNLKKFAVKTSTGTVVDQSDKPVFKDGKVQEKLSDYWYESAGSSDDDVYMAWGGLLSKLKVHHKPLITSGNLGSNRNVYLDVGVNNGSALKHAVTDILNGTTSLNNKQYLYGLLGYSKLTQSDFDALASKSYNEQLSYLQTKTNTKDFQMGSVIHSTPIMLTQKGVFEEKDGEYGVTTREDYILAGTTQGLVQVVNADNGKEVFSFLPSEFLTRTNNPQEKGFAESLALDRFTTANTDKFFYGIDGPWVAHTEYEYIFEDDKEIMTAKKQYAYGGLRMGGRSYYALDLTDLGKTSGKPKLLFAIKPDNHTSGALSYMGESWSKPVITYIPWKGHKKLAMIVGGGYDRKYESQNVSGDVKGNGIYIFAAEDLDTNTKAGSLLWWGSSNATNSTSSTKIDAMTHSIPSRVKAVDRNGDGVTDHLYVGDLGGQLFRVDFNSKLGTTAANTVLVHQATKIADLNTSGKTARRFYEAPTFTIHKDDTTGKRFAMVTLASGDRSSPLDTSTSYPQDYVVAIEDDTVTSSPVGTPTLITLDSMHDISGTGSFNKGTHKGWFFPMPKVGKDAKHQVRAMEEGIALDNDLYYSLFNPDESTAKDGDATECTGGIVGSSSAYKFCLPFGACGANQNASNPEVVAELGAGIIGLTLGAGRTKDTHRTLIFNKEILPNPAAEYAVTDKLVPKRWFEYLPFNSGGK